MKKIIQVVALILMVVFCGKISVNAAEEFHPEERTVYTYSDTMIYAADRATIVLSGLEAGTPLHMVGVYYEDIDNPFADAWRVVEIGGENFYIYYSNVCDRKVIAPVSVSFFNPYTGQQENHRCTTMSDVEKTIRRILDNAVEEYIPKGENNWNATFLFNEVENYISYGGFIQLMKYNEFQEDGGNGNSKRTSIYYLNTFEERIYVDQFVKQKALELNIGTDYEKIKNVHDFIINHTQYYYQYEDDWTYATDYTALVNQLTVCQGYAMLFQKFMEEMGIESYIVSSKAGGDNHAWNIVKLDGQYYQVDCTWDDTGKSKYQYFLRGNNIKSHTYNGKLPIAPNNYPDNLN